jgi:hypothetical protein
VRPQQEKILAAQCANRLLHCLWGKLWGRWG